jgi:hypothetical protein
LDKSEEYELMFNLKFIPFFFFFDLAIEGSCVGEKLSSGREKETVD